MHIPLLDGCTAFFFWCELQNVGYVIFHNFLDEYKMRIWAKAHNMSLQENLLGKFKQLWNRWVIVSHRILYDFCACCWYSPPLIIPPNPRLLCLILSLNAVCLLSAALYLLKEQHIQFTWFKHEHKQHVQLNDTLVPKVFTLHNSKLPIPPMILQTLVKKCVTHRSSAKVLW